MAGWTRHQTILGTVSRLNGDLQWCLEAFGIMASPSDKMTSSFVTMTSPFKTMTSPFDIMTSPFDTMTSPFDTMTSPFDTVTAPLDTIMSPFVTMTRHQSIEWRHHWCRATDTMAAPPGIVPEWGRPGDQPVVTIGHVRVDHGCSWSL